MLKKLISNDNQNSTAIAYQIAFDLYDNGTQEFLAKVIKDLPKKVEEVASELEADKENRKLYSVSICSQSSFFLEFPVNQLYQLLNPINYLGSSATVYPAHPISQIHT